ncbi:MAG: peptidylprolyl isomerase [Cyanobacteriota bacterium]|nr:peptidylprolyl isomerase [Cyanobacteriota bacterium]
MSAILQVGNQKIAAEQFVSILKSSHLLPQLLREFFIEQAIAPIEPTAEELQQYCEQLARRPENYGVSPQQIQLSAPRQLKLEQFKETTWGDRVEATFYNCREQLDRVLFSLIQSEDVEIIQELYFRLQEGEASFAKLASQYSQGPEAHTNGLVGPIELNNLHPKLAQVLKVSQPGQISPPVRVDKWLTIVRLERYIPAQYDEKMRKRLLDELFEAWLQEKIVRVQQSGSVNFPLNAELPAIAFEEEEVAPAENPTVLSEADEEQGEETSSLSASEPVRALPARSQRTSPGKVAMTLMLCLVPFGLGIFTVNTFTRLASQRAEGPQQPDSPSPETIDVRSEDAFRTAVNHASEAATLTQTAQSQSEWQLVIRNWQNAIALMEKVPNESAERTVAREKISEYQQNLDYAQGMVSKSVDAFHEAVHNAMSAANLTQTAQSSQEWKTVAQRWQKAIAFMQAVPSDSRNYEIARSRVSEYQRNLDYAKEKANQS